VPETKGRASTSAATGAGAAGVPPGRGACRDAHVGADDAALLELPGDDAGAAGRVEDEPFGGGRQHLGDEVEPRALPRPLQAPALL
jgi:hypothetical protein